MTQNELEQLIADEIERQFSQGNGDWTGGAGRSTGDPDLTIGLDGELNISELARKILR